LLHLGLLKLFHFSLLSLPSLVLLLLGCLQERRVLDEQRSGLIDELRNRVAVLIAV
jgi:hypothetical protein